MEVDVILHNPLSSFSSNMSRGMRFPTNLHFDKCRFRQALCSLHFSLDTPNGVQSVA